MAVTLGSYFPYNLQKALQVEDVGSLTDWMDQILHLITFSFTAFGPYNTGENSSPDLKCFSSRRQMPDTLFTRRETVSECDPGWGLRGASVLFMTISDPLGKT